MNALVAHHAYDLNPWYSLSHLALADFEEEAIRAGIPSVIADPYCKMIREYRHPNSRSGVERASYP